MTSINLPGAQVGIAEHGRKTVEEMVELIRSYALDQKAKADAILAAAPSDFRVATWRSLKDRDVLQQGKSRENDNGNSSGA